jgi:hypothetical protein
MARDDMAAFAAVAVVLSAAAVMLAEIVCRLL